MTQQIILGKHFPSMSVARNGVASAVLNGKLYAIGGSYNGNRSFSMRNLRSKTESWSSGPSLCMPKLFHMLHYINGKIYLIGE